jgi:uncharacterized repeat protein (TIGR02543 family)
MNRGSAIAIIAAIVIVLAGIGAFIALSGGHDDVPEKDDPTIDPVIPGDTYTITYILNGGTLVDDAPTSYTAGVYTALPYAYKEGMKLLGWYADAELTTPVGAILATDSGDLTLYAAWYETKVGQYYSMDVSYITSFVKQSGGNITIRYLAEDADGAVYLERTITTRSIFGPSTTTESFWSDELDDPDDDSVFVYLGNETLTYGSEELVCEKWADQNGTTQWVHGFIAVRIVEQMDGYNTQYDLADYGSFEPDARMTIEIVADVGVGIEGDLEVDIGDTVTLTAVADEFYGWFLDGEMVSDGRTLEIFRATPGLVYEARATEGSIELDTLTVDTAEMGLSGRIAVLYPDGTVRTGNSGTITFKTSGYYTIQDSGSPITKQLRLYLSIQYRITYVLNGGQLPDYSPDTYELGVYTDLPYPTNGDMYFDGWYSDSACTEPVGAILATDSGDKTLYASWSENKVGQGYTMKITRSSMFWTTDIGTYTIEYMAMDDDGNYFRKSTIKSGGNTYSFGSWSDEGGDSTYTYLGNGGVRFNGKVYNCEIWQNETGQQEYVYRSFYVMYIEAGDRTFAITDMFTFEPETVTTMNLVADVGLDITGDLSATIGGTATLTAVGDEFYAWYVDGVKSSEDRTLVVDRVSPGVKYEARSGSESMMLTGNTLDTVAMGLTGSVTVTYDGYDSIDYPAGTITLDHPGSMTIVDSSAPVAKQIRIFIDLTKTFSAEWEYEGKTYTYSVEMKYSDIIAYSENDDLKKRSTFSSAEIMNRYFTVDDGYVHDVVSALGMYRDALKLDDKEFALFVLRFVESIEYDASERGYSEYIKYPAEYMWDCAGDCEDSSIFYATLMYALGYDSGIAIFTKNVPYGHAMGIVYIEGDTSGYARTITIDGKEYAFAETTDNGIEAGLKNGYQLGDTYSSSYSAKNVTYQYLVKNAFASS